MKQKMERKLGKDTRPGKKIIAKLSLFLGKVIFVQPQVSMSHFHGYQIF
jgi:hypothetical protein